MKRMIDNKDYDALKSEVSEVITDIETHATDYIITDVVVEDEEVKGFIIKDVENEITYNIDLEGGSKQPIKHNITLKYDGGAAMGNISFTIENDSEDDFTLTTLYNYIKEKYSVDASSNKSGLVVSGNFANSAQSHNGVAHNICYDNANDRILVRYSNPSSNWSYIYEDLFSFNSNITTLYQNKS